MKWADENEPRKFPRGWPTDPLSRRFNRFGGCVYFGAAIVFLTIIGAVVLLVRVFG